MYRKSLPIPSLDAKLERVKLRLLIGNFSEKKTDDFWYKFV